MLVGIPLALVIVFAPRTMKGHLTAYLVCLAGLAALNLLLAAPMLRHMGSADFMMFAARLGFMLAFYVAVVAGITSLWRRYFYGYWWNV